MWTWPWCPTAVAAGVEQVNTLVNVARMQDRHVKLNVPKMARASRAKLATGKTTQARCEHTHTLVIRSAGERGRGVILKQLGLVYFSNTI